MANLRLVNIKAEDSTTILAKFTADLDPLINTSNVVVTSITPGVPDPSTLKVVIDGPVLRAYIQPLTPLASYDVTFQSDSVTFKSKDGQSVLFEDGKTNVVLIIGPEEPADQVRDFLINFLKDSVYNLDTGTLVRDIINSQSKNLSKAIHDVGQAKNDNYLQFNVIDEAKTRGSGPFDRLNEEGAFEVVRVGTRPGASTSSGSISYDSFPRGPITLQAITISSETLVAGTGPSTFNDLILTVANGPVTKLNSVTVIYADHSTATYNIAQYGYQIKNPRYDQDFASTLLTLEDNQFKLSRVILDTTFVVPVAGDTVVVNYDYKHTGRIIEQDSVAVSQVLDAIREPIPPILTEFTLDHSPVVDANDDVENFGGVTWLDPLSNPPFSDTHPAFIKEVPYKFEGLPANPGEFSIDYNTGRVFVYGEETNDGTGNYPPVATYKYRNTFDSRIDYTYNPDTYELVASPLRELPTEQAKVSYDFEQTLIPDVDFVAQVHQESLNERVENRINSTIAVSVLNTPITNVFRVYNETSGEVYAVTRFTDNVIYFNSTVPPRILDAERERASFQNVSNEILLISGERINILGTRVLTVVLENNRIMSASEDVLGASYNSSVDFSQTTIFSQELFFDGQILSADANTDRLTVGQYQIDYRNGIVYIGVAADQGQDLGTVNYRSSVIIPRYPHLISVSELYHSISEVTGVNKRVDYTSFDDGEIQPSTFDVADERFLNGDTTLPYLVISGRITVSDDIKNLRFIYDAYDLTNNEDPTNFAEGATVSANVITLATAGVDKRDLSSIGAGLVVTMPFISSGAGISGVESVIRVSDGVELWDGYGSFLNYDITLSGVTGAPAVGEAVVVLYRVKLNGAATPIVDYNRGDYFADYTYLADEILVSYEYGDNVIDFRKSGALDEGDEYYVTYKVGALRDSLLQNFGTLVDIPVVNTFDVSLARESYRDALKAALQSFTKGPTLPSMKLLVSNITKIDPEIIEGVFNHWSLGISHLYPNAIGYTDGIQLLAGKFDAGVLLENPGETITFPVSSNLRLENGSLEMWVIPEWDGIDNDATLTFQVYQAGTILDSSKVFIGASSFNPTYDDDNKFSINRRDDPSPEGLPSKIFTHTGFFIYYDPDAKKWNALAREDVSAFLFGTGPSFGSGYVFGSSESEYLFSGTIETSGEMYDVGFKPGLGEINDVLRSGTKTIEFEFNLDGYDVISPDGYGASNGYFPGDGYVPGYSFDGITFMSDDHHYLFDWGESSTKNRFSLFKDGRGYLNFRVWDRGSQRANKSHKYDVTTDISEWVAGQKHHVGLSWCLNTAERMDEMHLFVDGFEVPNIMRYGGRPIAAQTDRFRTVKPEIVAGIVPKNTRTGNDMTTRAGSPTVVSASIDFAAEGIIAGDTINILESGFGTFTILFVAANTLLLDGPMPSSFTDARFSVNEYSVVVSTHVDLFANIAVSIMDGYSGVETEIPGLRADIPAYSISKNMLNENILTLLGNANAGDTIILRTLGLNHRRCRDTAYVWGNTSHVFRTQLPPPVSLDEVSIKPVLLPLTNVNPNNAVLVGARFVLSGLSATQPSSPTEGRTLSIRMSGGNVNYGTPPTVTIFGTTASGAPSETLTFTSATTQTSSEKFKTVTSITIEVTPTVTTLPSVSVEVKEAYSMIVSEGNATYPVIRFSYKSQSGTTLEGAAGDIVVTDNQGFFIDSHVGNSLVVYSPASVAGTYTIVSRVDEHNIAVSPAPPATFTDATYDIFITSMGRNGFQNGFFTLETAGEVDTPFLIQEGLYEFDYAAYLEIPFDPISQLAYVGSDFNAQNQAKAVIDELRILSTKITDVRVGESIGVNEKSFTVSYTALNPFIADRDTLMLLHFDGLPLENAADFWITSEKMYLQSSNSVNSEFEKSILVTDSPLTLDNKGLLSTYSEGSIEFWVSPRFDTYNDPNIRFYFDATSAVVEEVVSVTNGTVQVSGSISGVLSVRLQTDTYNTGTNFFNGGSISSDFRTINLGRALPYQKTPVKVTYVPAGLSGDRISIFKNREGLLVFNVRAGGIDYQINQTIFWARDTWHRVQATYKFNRPDNLDEIRLFIDGEESGVILFGSGLLFGQGVVFAQNMVGAGVAYPIYYGSGIIYGQGTVYGQIISSGNRIITDINFSDPINQIHIGGDFMGTNIAHARFDNLRLSNISRNPLVVAGQPKDINFSTNREIVLPVIEDAFTTFLLDFNTLVYKTDDLALLRNEVFGIHNFDLNVIDSFDIVLSDAKIQQILEALVYALKPAQSKVNISYIQ